MARNQFYRDYTAGITPREAFRMLVPLAIAVVAIEILLRVRPPEVRRNPAGGLQALRVQSITASEDPGAKVLLFGDSSLQGGGVSDDQKIVAGRLAQALRPEYRTYNMAVPGGNNRSTVQILRGLANLGVPKVDLIIIETLPTKWFVDSGEVGVREAIANTALETYRYLPIADSDGGRFHSAGTSLPERVDLRLRYEAAKRSAIFRHRDAFRIRLTGAYPAFWAANTLLPAGLRARMLGSKADGTNRLGANLEDGPFNPHDSQPSDKTIRFRPNDEATALVEAIRLAKSISKYPPLVLAQPIHYEYEEISSRERQGWRVGLADLKLYMLGLCNENGTDLLFIPSEPYQADSLWTRTPAHYNEELHAKVGEALIERVQEELSK